ncbi:uncharacterized protein [Littorina saxatilis]|uniref:uncharacterized protein isoform X2 n=1 Tax=Littorina saxatilis TaxID=31220 RepID=UPI0038B42064
MDTGATNLDADLIIEAVATCVRQVLESPDNEEYLQLQAAPEQPAVPLHGAEGETSCRPVGRMKKDIDMDFVCDLLFELHMPLTKVAALCQVSRPTLYKRLRDEGIDTSCSRFTDISEEDLERHVREIKGHHPNAGLVYLTGHLRSRGVFVQRQKILD